MKAPETPEEATTQMHAIVHRRRNALQAIAALDKGEHAMTIAQVDHRARPTIRKAANAMPNQPTAALETIAPDRAARYLERNVGYNRRISRAVVATYAKLMRDGAWTISNDDICFDVDGFLINGQHRLHAIIESGTAQTFGVKRGLSLDAFRNMDTGSKRGLSDVLDIVGVEYASLSASVAKRTAFYAKAGYLTAAISHGSNSSAGNPLHASREDQFEVAIGYAPIKEAIAFVGPKNTTFKKVGLTATQVGFAHVLFSSWHDGFEDFVTRLLQRDFTGRNDPANQLLDRMLASLTSAVNSPNRLSPAATFGYLVLAANADSKKRGLSKLQWSRVGYPQPIVQIAERITEALDWPAPKGKDEDSE